MPPYNFRIDLILAGLLAIGILRGTLRGLSGELASLISLIGALFVGWQSYRPLGSYLTGSTRLSDFQAETVAFFTILVLVMVLLWVIRFVLKRIMEVTFKGLLERIGGGLFGLIRYAAVLSTVIFLIALFGHGALRRQIVEESFLGRNAYALLRPIYDNWAQQHPSWTEHLPTGHKDHMEESDGNELDSD